MSTASRPLIIGIGNQFRSDDAVGVVIAEGIAERLREQVELLIHKGDPAYLLDAWQQRDLVVVADAVNEDGQAEGKIYFWDALNGKIPASEIQVSTHSIGVASAIELGKCLAQLPDNLWVCGINSHQFHMGEQLSVEVTESANVLIDALSKRLQVYLSDKRTEEKSNA